MSPARAGTVVVDELARGESANGGTPCDPEVAGKENPQPRRLEHVLDYAQGQRRGDAANRQVSRDIENRGARATVDAREIRNSNGSDASRDGNAFSSREGHSSDRSHFTLRRCMDSPRAVTNFSELRSDILVWILAGVATIEL